MSEQYYPYTMDLPAHQAAKQAKREADIEREYKATRERGRKESERMRVELEAAEKARAEREAEIKLRREELVREQAAAMKAEALRQYIAAGGNPDEFEADYPAIRARLLAERMAERERRIAHPADHARGEREQSSTFTEPIGE